MDPEDRQVTTVVITRDRRDSLLRTLGHLTGPVVLVDNGSHDGTPEAVLALGRPDVHVIELGRNAGATARNTGVRAARTALVAFSDDDSWWAPGALERAADVFGRHPRLGLLAARVVLEPSGRTDPVCELMRGSPLGTSPDLPGPEVLGFVACATIVRRDAFLAAGGFDDVVFFAGEEERLAIDLASAGWGLAYVDDLVAHHAPDEHRATRAQRGVMITRNQVLTAVMRRPWSVVLHSVAVAARESPATRRGLVLAVLRSAKAVARRRRVPAGLECRLRQLVDGTPAPSAQHAPSGGWSQGRTDERVGVVVITRERRDEAVACLDRLATLPELPQVVLVDNGSSDGTVAAANRAHPEVDVVALDRNLGAAGRNVGAARLDTPYVAFCDDDTWWEPGALRLAADALDAHARLAVVQARIVVEPGGADDPVVAELRDSPVPAPSWLPGPALGSFLAGASVVRRSAFTACGGFSERLLFAGEEELLAVDLLVAGWELCYLEDLVVHHRASAARDPHRRRRDGLRNTLWFTWLRQPTPIATRRTAFLARTVPRDRVSLAAFGDAVRGLGWVLVERRVMPAELADRLAGLYRAQSRSSARRYVS